MSSEKQFKSKNINGVLLSLTIETKSCSPSSKKFTISFHNEKKNDSYHNKYIFGLAVLFNILALLYIRINITTFLVVFVAFTSLLIFWITHSVQSESILVIPTVAIQSTVKYVYGKEDHFVSWSSIQDVIINEVIKLNRVVYYLTLIVSPSRPDENSDPVKLIPLFKYTKPRLAMLECIYKELQSLLAEERLRANGSGDADYCMNSEFTVN